MLFKRVSRTDPEKIFAVCKNGYSTAALSSGQAVTWDFITLADGVGVTMPLARATNAGVAVAGIIAQAIAIGAYGLVQVYGYHSAVRVRTITGNDPAITSGSPLALNAAGSVFCLESYDSGSTNIQVAPCGFALAASAVWTTAAIAAFIKAL